MSRNSREQAMRTKRSRNTLLAQVQSGAGTGVLQRHPGLLRGRLEEMSQEEVLAWLQSRRDVLAELSAYLRGYLEGRARRRIHTSTDDTYNGYLPYINDLLVGLDEMIEAGKREAAKPGDAS